MPRLHFKDGSFNDPEGKLAFNIVDSTIYDIYSSWWCDQGLHLRNPTQYFWGSHKAFVLQGWLFYNALSRRIRVFSSSSGSI